YLTEIVRVSGSVKQYQSSGGLPPSLDPISFALSNSITPGILRVGWDTAAGEYFNGDIAELLFYNRSLSSSEQTALEAYLRLKYWNASGTASNATLAGTGGSDTFSGSAHAAAGPSHASLTGVGNPDTFLGSAHFTGHASLAGVGQSDTFLGS